MTCLNSFDGKYAIITGSTQGLGEATARLFVKRGAASIVFCSVIGAGFAPQPPPEKVVAI